MQGSRPRLPHPVGPTVPVIPAPSHPTRPRRVDHRAARCRLRRGTGNGTRRAGRLALASAVTALLLGAPPALVPVGLACPPIDADTAVLTVGALAGDGEVEQLEQRLVGADGATCTVDDDRSLTVGVGIVHEAVSGRSLEATELTRAAGPVTTRVSVRDVTARSREVVVSGPLGTRAVQRNLGVPQLVHLEVRYPAGWSVTAPEGDGVGTAVEDGEVAVRRAGVLFPPLLPDELVLTVVATPARGTPTISIDVTPLAGVEPFVLPDGVLDRDAAAVLGALGSLAADGATELADGAGAVASGARELAAGTETLADGVTELAEGAGALAAGAAEVADGARGLAGGLGGFSDGVEQLSDGVGASAGGARALAEGTTEVTAGTRQLAAAAAELAAGSAELAAGARQLADGLDAATDLDLPDGDVATVVAGIGEVAAGIAEVRDGLAATVPEGTDPTDPTDPAAPIAIAVAALTALADATLALAGELGAGLVLIGDAVSGIEAAAAGAEELAVGAAGIAEGNAALAAGLDELARGSAALAGGADELAGGLGQLSGASGELAAGSGQLAAGSRELAAGTGGIADGSAEVAVGTGDLAVGSAELAEGGAQLAAGTDELAEGARQLPDALAEVVAIADRSGQDTAVTVAVLESGSRLAAAERGEAALVATQLRHEGQHPLPVAAVLSSVGSVLALLLGVLGLRWRLGRRA